jgi:acetyl-CoA carboxylase biotin carboxyl carrier protein
MTRPDRGDAEPAPGAGLEAVRQATIDLLKSLPERPERLCVRAADVTVDLDWRSPAVRVMTSTPAGAGQTADRPAESRPEDLPAEELLPILKYVCAPSIGTFYSAPEPGATPFVVKGSTVNAGQQVAIIELMKLMLPVEADRQGRVVEVLVEDGQSVEFGDRLLALEPFVTE